MKRLVIGVIGLVLAHQGLGCDGVSPLPCEVVPGTPSEARADGLAALERDVLAPTRAALLAASGELVAAVVDLCATPDTGKLATAREAWFEVQGPIKSFELFMIGPLLSERLYSRLQFWPTRGERLQTLISAIPEGGYTPAEVVDFGTAVTGLGALEAILFQGDTVSADACHYAEAIALDLQANATTLEALSSGPSGFGHEIATAGRGSTVFSCVQPAVDDFVNTFVTGIQRLQETKLGGPLGVASGGQPSLSALEHPYAAANLRSIEASLTTFEAMWTGAGGFGQAVRRDSAPIYEGVVSQLATIQATLDAALAAGPMASQLTGDSSLIVALRAKIKVLYRLVSVEVANILGTRLRFSDNDGD